MSGGTRVSTFERGENASAMTVTITTIRRSRHGSRSMRSRVGWLRCSCSQDGPFIYANRMSSVRRDADERGGRCGTCVGVTFITPDASGEGLRRSGHYNRHHERSRRATRQAPSPILAAKEFL